jgi:hypothetical protein
MEAVKNDGGLLKYASLELQNNYKIVIEAVKNTGYALEHASCELQNNYKIVIEAVKNSRVCIKILFKYSTKQLFYNINYNKNIRRG